jgi:hypothetical protein
MNFNEWINSQPQDVKLQRELLEIAYNAGSKSEREICASICEAVAVSASCASRGKNAQIAISVAKNCASMIRSRN